MGKFARQTATALRLIEENGQLVTWKQVTDGSPADPAKPWKPSAASVVDNSVYMAFLPESRTGFETLHGVSGGVLPEGCLLGYMGAQAFTPTIKDKVVRDGNTLAIESIDTIAPNGDVILHIIRFER